MKKKKPTEGLTCKQGSTLGIFYKFKQANLA